MWRAIRLQYYNQNTHTHTRTPKTSAPTTTVEGVGLGSNSSGDKTKQRGARQPRRHFGLSSHPMPESITRDIGNESDVDVALRGRRTPFQSTSQRNGSSNIALANPSDLRHRVATSASRPTHANHTHRCESDRPQLPIDRDGLHSHYLEFTILGACAPSSSTVSGVDMQCNRSSRALASSRAII